MYKPRRAYSSRDAPAKGWYRAELSGHLEGRSFRFEDGSLYVDDVAIPVSDGELRVHISYSETWELVEGEDPVIEVPMRTML